IKTMNSEGHGFVGYSFKDGKYVSSKVEGGQIETGSKAELLTLVKAARKAAVVLGGLDSVNARAETSIKAIQAEIDKLLAAKEVDPEVAREYQNLVNITATYITNGIRVLKIGVAENGVRAVGNVLSFANASL
ncbi:hypothetical protein, partial [Staphylococcus aureus]|uniref:hypothetical protein n=1 Tax=Staphylococcus aureus TaxID=1280 RepID=UPI0018A7D65C